MTPGPHFLSPAPIGLHTHSGPDVLHRSLRRPPMLPHLRWVCVQNGVKDRNPLRDEGNRWGKPSSAFFRRPWGASAAKIDVIFPCSSLRLLLLKPLVIAGLDILSELPRVRQMGLTTSASDGTGGSRLPISWPGNSCRLSPRPPRLLKSARPGLQLPHSVEGLFHVKRSSPSLHHSSLHFSASCSIFPDEPGRCREHRRRQHPVPRYDLLPTVEKAPL